MSEMTAEHGATSDPQRPRCQECWDIKRKRAQALETGDRQTAVKMTETMGIHLRKAHA
ncbi:hypothetical protein [Streptomyces cinnamoneus]